MIAYARTLVSRYRTCFSNKRFSVSFIVALLILAAALFASAYAVQYATENASNPVTDLVLSNIGPYDVDSLFVNGAVTMVVGIALVCLADPRRIPFTVKTIALFVVVRSVFITLTHIGAFPTETLIQPDSQNLIQAIIGARLYSSFFLGNDFFFSGHTGLPFIMAFLYFDKRWLRYIFIILSIFFGVVVLLGHLHYTIDVLSAFFISYGIYHMSRHFFKSDLPAGLSTLR